MASFKEPSYNTGYESLKGVDPAQPSAYKLLAACADDDPDHVDDNLDKIDHLVTDCNESPDGSRYHRFSPPLHLAIGRGGSFAIVSKLLQLGADPNRADRMCVGARPLHFACARNNEKLVAALLEAAPVAADPNLLDKHGSSPLHIAATIGSLKLLVLLVNAGADLDIAARHNGDTPLHAAVRRGQLEFVQALLKAGANPEPPFVIRSKSRRHLDEYGEIALVETPSATNLTPAMLARSLGLGKIAEALPPIKGA